MYLPYCVYVLKSLRDGKNYTGFSSNLEERINDHNNGGTKSTAERRPLKLIYCEFHISKADAKRRERYFKSTDGKRTLKYILRDFLKNS